MKKLLLILLVVPLFAADYSFLNYEKSYSQASKQAKKEQKLLMLVVVSQQCGWCYKLAKQTLLDPKVKKKINQSFIPLLLNIDINFIPQKYRCPSVPAVYFIDPIYDEEIWRGKGYKDVPHFLLLIEQALHSHQEDLADEEE